MNQQEEIDIIVELRVHIARKYITRRAAAKAWGYTDAFVSLVLKDKRYPTEIMLADAGFCKLGAVHRYERVK